MIARLSRLVLTVRGSEGVLSAVDFYNRCLGLQVYRVTEDWAEMIIETQQQPRAPASKTVTNENKGDGSTTSNADILNNDDNNSSSRILLTIQGINNGVESKLTTGYTPILTFQLENGEMDSTIALCAQSGAHLDGPIQYPAYGKIASLRTPHGHMIGLYEPNV